MFVYYLAMISCYAIIMALTEIALNMEIKGFAKILALGAGVPYG